LFFFQIVGLLVVVVFGGDVDSVVEIFAFFAGRARSTHSAPWRHACVTMLLIWTLPAFENIAV
jgi:hypothetical protein